MELSIRLSDESAYVEVSGVAPNGEMFQKKVTPRQLLELLNHSLCESEDGGGQRNYNLVVPVPLRCLSYERIEGFYLGSQNDSGSKRAIFYLPSERRVMYYQTTENPYVFELPALVFYMETIKNKVDTSEMRIFAVKEKSVSEIGSDTKLYHYPFGNVYANGRICWGGTQLSEVETMNDFKKIILTFLGSVTNDDLFSGTNRVNKKITCQRELLEYLVQEEKFPNKLLVDTKRTLKELEKKLTK